MDRSNIVPFAPNLVLCCIDEYRQGRYQGRLYLSNVKEPYLFTDISDMLLKIDSYFDQIDFPMKSMELRSFEDCQPKPYKRKYMKRTCDPDVLKYRGKEATFIIHVQYRQNCSWQGKIIWADRNKAKSFRSELEVIHLMDGALKEATYEQSKISE